MHIVSHPHRQSRSSAGLSIGAWATLDAAALLLLLHFPPCRLWTRDAWKGHHHHQPGAGSAQRSGQNQLMIDTHW